MHFLSWLDNRTLLACQCLLATAFACGMMAFRYSYPTLRGTRSFAIAFLLGIPATLLLAMRGHISFFLSAVVGNLLVYVVYLLLYRGLLQFFQDDRYFNFSVILVIIASALQIYYALVDDRIVVRIIFICITMCILSWLKCWTLLVHSQHRIHRLLFAAVAFVAGIISLTRAVLTVLHGAPQDFMQQNVIQTYNFLFGLVGIFLQGIFYLSLVYFDLNSTIENSAQLDPLTGILNRRGIEQKLSEELARSHRSGTSVAVLLVDLDHFKDINDTRGHNAGDAALRQVASTISSILCPYDQLGRFGGDEFLLVLPEASPLAAQPLAERLRQTLALIPGAPTLSIGIAQSDPGESVPSLLARADSALYQAKNAGRNCIRLGPSSVSGLHTAQTALPR